MICTTDDEECMLRNIFSKVKYIVFKIKILIVLLLCCSFGNGENTIAAIDYRAVSLLRYSAGILKWTKDVLKVVGSKTRKIITINRMYRP